MLIRRPAAPIAKTRSGLSIVSGETILFNDSTRIEKQSATRKTELTRAPRTSALTHPNVFLLMVLRRLS